MPQITIYINNDLEKQIKMMASSLDISLSKLIASVLEQKFNSEWNPSVKQLAGSWQDFPSLEEIRETEGQDVGRESF